MTDKASFLAFIKQSVQADPSAAARSLEKLGEPEIAEVLGQLAPSLAADLVRHLDEKKAARVFIAFPPTFFDDVIEALDPEEAAKVFVHLSEEKRQEVFKSMESKKRRRIKEIIAYPEDSAGRIMKSDFISFHEQTKVRLAVEKIRRLAEKGFPASYVYVVNEDKRLVGVMNMRDMLFADEESELASVMRKDVFAVDCFTHLEKIAKDLSVRSFFVAPVVDKEKKLIGVIRAEELIGDVQEEATEDIQKMFGAGGDEWAFSSLRFSLRQRLPWLSVNLLGALGISFLLSFFFRKGSWAVPDFLLFLPLFFTVGSSAGAQSLAVTVRAIVIHELPAKKGRKLVLKETSLGALSGFLMGALSGLIAWLWLGSVVLAVLLAGAMTAYLAFSGFSGASLPLLMKQMRLDPSQSSHIILAIITSLAGFSMFFFLVLLFQYRL